MPTTVIAGLPLATQFASLHSPIWRGQLVERLAPTDLAAKVFGRLDRSSEGGDGVELRAGDHVVDEVGGLAPRRQVAHAGHHHVDTAGLERRQHLGEGGLLPLDLDAELLGDGLAQLDVEAGERIGGGVLEGDRRIVRLGRDDELAGGLDPLRQGLGLGAQGSCGQEGRGEGDAKHWEVSFRRWVRSKRLR